MLSTLAELARIALTPSPKMTEGQVTHACAILRDILGAEDAYIIRSGDPHFVRLGSSDDPRSYEIKQRGYWVVWKELATNPNLSSGVFTVEK